MASLQLVLASASIGRKGLLERLGVPFEIIVSTVDEDKIVDPNPYQTIKLRAGAKAEDVVSRIKNKESRIKEGNSHNNHDSLFMSRDSFLIIAADSMAILGNETFGKSKDQKDAARMVRSLMGPPANASRKRSRAGKTHTFTTATTIVHLKDKKIVKRWDKLTKTLVTCRTMSKQEIEAYVSRYDFTKLAAAYALDRTPWDWITKIEGSYTNVVGLPFEIILPIFRKFQLI